MGGNRGKRATAARVGAFVWAVVVVVGTLATPAGAAVPAAGGARLRIKNSHTVMVALGRTRESASGIRPDTKKVWTLELPADVVGAVAELDDVTPNVPGAHWSLPIATEHLVMDAARFLPSHVYRLEVRKDRHVVGSALVYLYPPPVQRVSRVVLDERSEANDARETSSGPGPGVTPKGGL